MPLFLLRNLCDALASCSTVTQPWIDTLTRMDWPFSYLSLDLCGEPAAPDASCSGSCSKARGLFEHVRFPRRPAFESMLRFFRDHPLP